MAQAGLHVPAEQGSRLPVFRSLFADIGDEQSISASLSTFSAHISHVVSMDRELALPSLVLLDEIGAGTDPIEGSALGIAVIDHFRARGAHLIATTHYDSLEIVRVHNARRDGSIVRLRSRYVCTDLSDCVRIAGPKPGHRDRGAPRHARVSHCRREGKSQRTGKAARRALEAHRR